MTQHLRWIHWLSSKGQIKGREHSCPSLLFLLSTWIWSLCCKIPLAVFRSLMQQHGNSYVSLRYSPTGTKTFLIREMNNGLLRVLFHKKNLNIIVSILDIVHPLLGQLPISPASGCTTASPRRGDEDFGTRKSSYSWGYPASTPHQGACQRDSKVNTA